MENKKFEDYGFKPSAVIEALNKWYEHGVGTFFKIERPDSKEGDRKYYTFRDHDKAIDAAIKYLRSMDIFYQPGMKWDDVKFKLNSRACLAEFGFNNVHDAWPKVNPCFVGPRTERENEIRDYILKRADVNGVKVPTTFRTNSVETLIAYLFELFVQERENKELIRKNSYIDTDSVLARLTFGPGCVVTDNDYLYRRELGLPDNATVANILDRIRDIRKANENQAKHASKLVQSIIDVAKERDEADRLRRHWHSKYEEEHKECVRLSKLHAADKEKKDKQDVVIHNLRDNNTTLEYSVAALKNKIRNMEAEAAEKETKNKVITDTLRDNLVDSIEECKRLNAKIKDLERTIRTLDDEEGE